MCCCCCCFEVKVAVAVAFAVVVAVAGAVEVAACHCYVVSCLVGGCWWMILVCWSVVRVVAVAVFDNLFRCGCGVSVVVTVVVSFALLPPFLSLMLLLLCCFVALLLCCFIASVLCRFASSCCDTLVLDAWCFLLP